MENIKGIHHILIAQMQAALTYKNRTQKGQFHTKKYMHITLVSKRPTYGGTAHRVNKVCMIYELVRYFNTRDQPFIENCFAKIMVGTFVKQINIGQYTTKQTYTELSKHQLTMTYSQINLSRAPLSSCRQDLELSESNSVNIQQTQTPDHASNCGFPIYHRHERVPSTIALWSTTCG